MSRATSQFRRGVRMQGIRRASNRRQDVRWSYTDKARSLDACLLCNLQFTKPRDSTFAAPTFSKLPSCFFSFFWVVRRLLRDHTGVPSKFVFHRRIHQETRDKFRSHGGAIRINIGARMHMYIHVFIILLHPPQKDMRQHRTAMISVVDTGAAHVDNTSACRHGVFDHVVFTTYLCM